MLHLGNELEGSYFTYISCPWINSVKTGRRWLQSTCHPLWAGFSAAVPCQWRQRSGSTTLWTGCLGFHTGCWQHHSKPHCGPCYLHNRAHTMITSICAYKNRASQTHLLKRAPSLSHRFCRFWVPAQDDAQRLCRGHGSCLSGRSSSQWMGHTYPEQPLPPPAR